MAVLAAMTDLEAVNRMLASIGQAPVSTIETSGIGDVAKARQQLIETARDVQAVGYSWNTDENYELTPDEATGYIALPSGTLDVDGMEPTRNVLIRMNPDSGVLSLYDADEQTFVFDEPVEVRIIWGYEFNHLPQAARSYIATAAARRFQAQIVSSTILDRFNEQDEDRAFALLLRHERRTRDTNTFRKSASLRRWTGARRF